MTTSFCNSCHQRCSQDQDWQDQDQGQHHSCQDQYQYQDRQWQDEDQDQDHSSQDQYQDQNQQWHDQDWHWQDQDRQFKPKINLFIPDVEWKRNVRPIHEKIYMMWFRVH